MRIRDKSSAAQWDRRHRFQNRKPSLWVGELVTPTGTHKCRVLNLSPSGAKVRIDAHVDLDDAVTLALDLVGTFVGSVKWQQDGCIGIAFSERQLRINEGLQAICNPAKSAQRA